MGGAARYAWLNRVVLAELVRKVLRETFQRDDSALLVDVPHTRGAPGTGPESPTARAPRRPARAICC
ncbi:RtcB family protein [Pseudomonas aeruginosa]|nr:RtcB family protein [Pseudomonas aeruginosa]